jgi:arginase family enzyme
MLTYAGVPYSDDGESDICIVGFTSDLGADTNAGQAGAPTHMRYHAYLPEGTYPFPPYKGSIVDAGDVVPSTRNNNLYMYDVSRNVAELANKSAVVYGIGGDDSVSYGMAVGLLQEYGSLGILHFDAHVDASDELSDTIAHGNWVRHVREHAPVKQWGCREHSSVAPFNDNISASTPILLVIDMDVIDPAYAPGVAVPVPFGYTPHKVLAAIQEQIVDRDVVGICITEITPDRDLRGQTAVLASHLANRVINLL